jgi:hypothetical protein
MLSSDGLPKLAYVGDVPVEASYHGSALLYRLFSTYPADRLCILESNAWKSQPERRLPNVPYRRLTLGSARLLNSRANPYYFPWVAWRAAGRAGQVARLLGGFQPQAVVTVMHGVSWITAARWAKQAGLPLHLIIHDDWISCSGYGPRLASWLNRQLESVYRQAATRWCASPYMARRYETLFGGASQVMLPTRANGTPVYREPKVREALSGAGFTVAYGGTVTLPGYAQAIRMLATALEALGGKVLLFSPLTTEHAQALGLDLPNIELRGLLPSTEFIKCVREEADALFVPMSFEEGQRSNMEIAFPSKFTDYTCAGLPLIVHGPEYCSAVRFAREHESFALVITTEEQTEFSESLRSLANSSRMRHDLASQAIRVGGLSFEIEPASQKFRNAILFTA